MAIETPPPTLGTPCPDFRLPAVDGKSYARDDFAASPVLVVMFICNHCPYVKAVVTKIVRDMNDLARHGVGAIAIMSNDVEAYPDDSFANMKTFAAQNRFTFPYVVDETQSVARAYDAVCTPDFFGFGNDLELQYHGRLDELFQAMTGSPPQKAMNSIGCSIKWKK